MNWATDIVVSERKRVPKEDAFVFCGRGGMLDRLRRWLWKRWSKQAIEEVVSYKHVRVNDDSFRKLICDAMNKGHMYPKDIERIIVGPEQIGYAVEEMHQAFEFLCDVSVASPLERIHIYGIRIQMVPWFDGVLLLPREK